MSYLSDRAGSRVAHRRSFQREPVGVMEDAVADGIGDTRLADGRVPRSRRELAGDERRAALAAIFDHLQQIPPFGLGE